MRLAKEWLQAAPVLLLCTTVFFVGGIVAVASGTPEYVAYVTTSLATVTAVLAAYRVERRREQPETAHDYVPFRP